MQYSPRQLAEDRLTLSVEYARASEELEHILAAKPSVWMKLREGVKSDTAAERAYQRTTDGVKEMQLRMKMKRIDKSSSAIRTLLSILEAEARNQM